MIECRTLFGKTRQIPVEKLVFRPTVYGIIIHNRSVLLTPQRSTGKYYLPGGGVELGESLENALRREIREEVGIEVAIRQMVAVKEHFFYYDLDDTAFHGFLFFYLCVPLTFTLLDSDKIQDDEALDPRWIPVDTLQLDQFQDHGALILDLLQQFV